MISSTPSESRESAEQPLIDGIRSELNEFSTQNKIRPLEDRIKRGLNEVGVLAVGKTNQIALQLATDIEADYDDLKKMTLDIQSGGPWEYAHALKEGEDPAVKAWMMISAATTMGREKEMDLVPEEFLTDVHRVESKLGDALDDPEKAFIESKAHLLEESKKTFRIEDGVPISEHDSGFIAMAVNGYESGVMQDADGMLFVGAKEIDEDVLKEWGLKKELREDRGRKDVEFFVNEKGEALLKKIYPGFAVVLSRNFDLAKAVAKASHEKTSQAHDVSDEALGHTRYEPTSAKNEEASEAWKAMKFLRRDRNKPVSAPESQETGLVRVKDQMFHDMGFIKSHVIFLDALESARERAAAKGKELNQGDIDTLAKKIDLKMDQKMEELKYMMEVIEPEFEHLPEGVDRVMDMAGGAGDLGIAVSTYLLANGKDLNRTEIVDPFSKQEGLDYFTEYITDYVPLGDELKSKVIHTNEALQEAEITEDAIVVAKHACGDLTDSIIEQWVDSESPLLVIMTCCQDKACKTPARYNIKQKDWETWLKATGKTNNPKPEKRKEGMEAMTKIDTARVEYLKRHGFEAKLHQTDKFPKGDVIVARRIKNN